jgi:Ca-activated chloride channel family protein
MVASFDEDIEIWCDFTNSREEIQRAIYRTKRGGNTKLYDAVDIMVTDALNKVQGRKAMVLFSDGVDTTSRYSNYKRSLEMMEESGALGYSVYYNTEMDNQSGPVINGRNPGGQPPIMTPPWPGRRRWPWNPFITFQRPGQWPGRGSRGGSSDEYARGHKYMQELADRSGGRLYIADTLSNLSYAFKQIAEELRHQYVIGYYPTNPNRDGSFRQVKVRVNQADLVVRARDGYRAGSDAQAGNGEVNERKRPALRRRQLAGAN